MDRQNNNNYDTDVGKNKFMDISSEKLETSHMRRPGDSYERETLREIRNYFWQPHKTTPQEPIILKRKAIIRNRMASVDYVGIET